MLASVQATQDTEGIELIFAHEMMRGNSGEVSECRRDSPELFSN